jgi:membrane dipeptidase
MNRRALIASLAAATASCALPRPADGVSSQAASLYDRALVVDGNLSPPFRNELPLPDASLDLVRNSGVTAVKMSLGGFDNDFESTLFGIAAAQRVFERHADVFMPVRRHADFAEAKRTRRMGVILSFESVVMLGEDVKRIAIFRGLGVRIMQLSYNTASPFGTGVLGDSSAGLTPLGRKAVEAMNASGVAIDISHANERTALDVLAASAAPPLITHAGCAAIHPHPRNKSDALLRAVADKGGAVGIFSLPYLVASPKQPALDDYLAHLTHALSVCGEDHVGIGTDGSLPARDTSPAALEAFRAQEEQRRKAGVAAPEDDGRPHLVLGLNTPRRSEIIADALLKAGYSSRVAEKVLGRNLADAIGRAWAE